MTTYFEAKQAPEFALNEVCLDALREIGNIGLGNAMTSLATMIDSGVNMSIPQVGVIPLAEFAELAGGGETVSACIYMPVAGDAPGHVAFFLPEASARHLADCLMGQPEGTTQEFDEITCSALMEIGNILASSYLAAICDMTGLMLLSSPPALAIDMTAALLSSIAGAFAASEDRALTIMTRIGEAGSAIEGFFVYVPEPGSLAILFRSLGMEAELMQCGARESATASMTEKMLDEMKAVRAARRVTKGSRGKAFKRKVA